MVPVCAGESSRWASGPALYAGSLWGRRFGFRIGEVSGGEVSGSAALVLPLVLLPAAALLAMLLPCTCCGLPVFFQPSCLFSVSPPCCRSQPRGLVAGC